LRYPRLSPLGPIKASGIGERVPQFIIGPDGG
jgi:hypothetical protein